MQREAVADGDAAAFGIAGEDAVDGIDAVVEEEDERVIQGETGGCVETQVA